MAKIYPQAYFGTSIVPIESANLSIASSAVLYGLSVYTVFPVCVGGDGKLLAFRLHDHWTRLTNSAKIIGIDTFTRDWTEEKFQKTVQEIIAANEIKEDTFVRVTIHVSDLVPGVRSRGLGTTLSIFIYEAVCILPAAGARLKTSVWRRVPDYAIPSRAKVNGAYVNSVLARQDALDSGYDDCLFLDVSGHVCELSAANVFVVRDGVLHLLWHVMQELPFQSALSTSQSYT
jgi:branched-chain amino acid aminotransferase